MLEISPLCWVSFYSEFNAEYEFIYNLFFSFIWERMRAMGEGVEIFSERYFKRFVSSFSAGLAKEGILFHGECKRNVIR